MVEAAFRGFIETTLDALLVFEGCRSGLLPKINRRLQEFEKKALVVSGAVFVFDEEETGIKRWTDGLTWSPSRTLGNFLLYRELDKGERKGNLGASGDTAFSADTTEAPTSGYQRPSSASYTLDRARERALVGSLTSTYRFRPDGLIKKTISLAGLHMISYYRIDDVLSGRLRTPSSLPELSSLDISPNFLVPSLFRIPPRIETGYDGQLRYVGEGADPAASPTLSSNVETVTPDRAAQQTFAPSTYESQLPGSSAYPYHAETSASFVAKRPTSSSSAGQRTQMARSVGRFEPYGIRPHEGYAGRPLSASVSASADQPSGYWSAPTAPISSQASGPIHTSGYDAYYTHSGPPLVTSQPPSSSGRSSFQPVRPFGSLPEGPVRQPSYENRSNESSIFNYQRPRTAASDTYDHSAPYETTFARPFDTRPGTGSKSAHWGLSAHSLGHLNDHGARYPPQDRHALPPHSQISPPRPTSSSSSASHARPPTAPWSGQEQPRSVPFDQSWAPQPGKASFPVQDTGFHQSESPSYPHTDMPFAPLGSFASYKRPAASGLVMAIPTYHHDHSRPSTSHSPSISPVATYAGMPAPGNHHANGMPPSPRSRQPESRAWQAAQRE